MCVDVKFFNFDPQSRYQWSTERPPQNTLKVTFQSKKTLTIQSRFNVLKFQMARALDNYHDSTDELWKQCASWLTRWGMLRPDHRANWPEACIADLARILRDGVLLCKLLNKIDPGCIDMKDVNLKPTMAQVN